MKGQTDSQGLLAWFLRNYYHLDDVEVDDSISDQPGDKGIDGIYINDSLQQIDIFQVRIGQANPPQDEGDHKVKNLQGTLLQFRDKTTVEKLTRTTRSKNLRKLLVNLDVASKVDEGYEVRGVYVTNRKRNQDLIDLINMDHPNLIIYDSIELLDRYSPIDRIDPIATPMTFNVAGVNVLRHKIEDGLSMAIAPLSAKELVTMDGIANQELFAWNLRYRLRRSQVNRAIEVSIGARAEHKYFPAFHNGLTVLCETLKVTRNKIKISGYAVVNGCQSLNALYYHQSDITPDLRVLTKFIEVSPTSKLAQKITDHTNNQNGITGRDQRSKDTTQARLQTDIHTKHAGEVYYRVSRGEGTDWPSDKVIENDAAAAILLAFDQKQPYSAHQRYKLFGDLYKDIFKQPYVNGDRIIALADIDALIRDRRPVMEHKAFAFYSLTPFLLLYLLREALETDEIGLAFCKNPSEFIDVPNGRLRIKHSIDPIITALMRIVDAYLKQQEDLDTEFDYRKDLKSVNKVRDIRAMVIPFYRTMIDSGFTKPFSSLWLESEAVFAP